MSIVQTADVFMRGIYVSLQHKELVNGRKLFGNDEYPDAAKKGEGDELGRGHGLVYK